MKQVIFSISGALGVDRAFAFLNRNRPVVLAFHGVTGEAPGHLCNHEGLHLHRPIFERLMSFIAARYHAVSLSRVVDWLEGRGTLPDRAVAVTFDDGYRNVLTQAGPALARLGIPATVFVATDFVFRGEMLWPDRLSSALHLTREPRLSVETPHGALDLPIASDADKVVAEGRLLAIMKSLHDAERIALLDRVVARLGVEGARLATAWHDHAPLAPDELAQLAEFGIEVGSHTCSHAIVTRMSEAQAKHELAESKRLIEAATGRACQHFSYPNGGPADYDARTRRYVIDAGYRSAVTTLKIAVRPAQDPFEIPRCVLTHNRITLSEFAAEVSGLPRFLRSVRRRLTGQLVGPEGGPWCAHARDANVA